MSRGRRRAFRVGMVLALLLAIPLAFRAAAALRESDDAHATAPPEGAFVPVLGADMYFQELGHASEAPTVLLVPGTMAWSGTFRDLATRLAAAGHHVVAIDLPPFGFSDRSAAHDYGRVAQAARIAAFVDARTLGRVVLVGHSFGGGPTVEAAMRLGPRVRGLGLLDAAIGLDAPPASGAPLGGALYLGFLRDTVVACSFTNVLGTGAAVRELVADDACVTDRRIAIYQRPFGVVETTHEVGNWLLTGLFADEHDARSMHEDAYRAFDAPALVVWGRADTVTPLAQGERLASLMPHAELVVLDGVGHIPHIENLDAVSTHLLAFLARVAREDVPKPP